MGHTRGRRNARANSRLIWADFARCSPIDCISSRGPVATPKKITTPHCFPVVPSWSIISAVNPRFLDTEISRGGQRFQWKLGHTFC